MKPQEPDKSFDTEGNFREDLEKIFKPVLDGIKTKLSKSPENAKKLENLASSMEKIQAINEKRWLSDGVAALNEFCDAVEGLKDIMNIDEELDDVDGLLDTIKSTLEEVKKEEISSLSDLMDAVIPVIGILMPLIEYGLDKVAP